MIIFRHKLKLSIALIGWTFLVFVVFEINNYFTKSGSILRYHSNICSARAIKYGGMNVDPMCNYLSTGTQVYKTLEPTAAAMPQMSKKFIHFRDLFHKTYSTQILTGADNVQDNTRYFIYRCDSVAMTHCGGWADRIRGILMTYLIANLTGRVFKAEMLFPPCDIKKFIVPNRVNWSLPVSFHKVINISNDVQIMNYINDVNFYRRVNTVNFMTLPAMKAKYVYHKSNLDYIDALQKSQFHQKQVSWMQNLTRDQITSELYKRLFKLNPGLQGKVEEFLSKNVPPSDKLICAHVRTGRNPTIPEDTAKRMKAKNFYKIWNFLRKISQGKNSKIFIMTDSRQFEKKIKQQPFRKKLLFSKGNIVHLENSPRATIHKKCAGLEKVIFDQLILMHCDTLLISNSGLGRMASYVRASDQDLFCILPGARIVPCERRNMKELFHVRN